jgi:hypothetical protein
MSTRNRTWIWLIAAALGPAAHAGVNDFTLTGPAGAAIYSVAFDPSDPTQVLAGGTQGLYRSVNGGLSWAVQNGNLLNAPSSIVFDPTHPSRVIIWNGQTQLSEDGGQTFALLQGPPTQRVIQRLRFASDGTLYAQTIEGTVYKSAPPFASWAAPTTSWPQNASGTAMTVDPQSPQTIYIGIEGQGIFRSTDGGSTWGVPLTNGIPINSIFTVYALAVHPTNANLLLAATNVGLFRSTNAGSSWTSVQGGPVMWVGFDPHDAAHASAIGSSTHLLRSIDIGATWISGDDLRVQGMPVGAFDPATDGRLLVATDNGMVETLDFGATFTYRNTGLRGGYPRAITVSDDGTVNVAMSLARDAMFRRSANYSPVGTASLTARTSGALALSSLASCAVDSQLLYAVNNGFELMRSDDGGTTWTSPHPAFSPGSGPVPDYINLVAVDPGNPLKAYTGRTATGLWHTTNRGATWTAFGNTPDYVGAIGVDPADANVIYIAAGYDATGIYKTTNGGASWTEQKPPGNVQFNSFTFHPTDSNIVYAVGYSGTYKTTNGGGEWTPVNFAPDDGMTVVGRQLLIDPLIPTTMVIVGAGDGVGFARTVDDGATWQRRLYGDPLNHLPYIQLTGAVVRPQQPNLLIMAAASGGLAEYEIAPDLDIQLTGPAGLLPLGSVNFLHATVHDIGVHDASAAEVRVTFPAWLTPTPPAGCTFTAPTLVCELGYIRLTQPKVIDINVAASTTPSTGSVVATVTGHERDPVSNNDASTLPLQSMEIADLVTAFDSGPAAVDNRATTALGVTVKNQGPNPSTSTTLVIDVGTAFTGAVVTPAQGTCTLAGSIATCALGTVAVGDAGVHVDVQAAANAVGTAQVTAVADGAGVDTNTNQGSVRNLTVRAVGDASVDVAQTAGPVVAGTAYQYTATVHNLSGDTAAVQFTATTTNATVTAVTSLGACTNTSSTVSCSLGSIAANASSTVTINVSAPAAGSASISAVVAYDGTDSAASNNTASGSTVISAPPAPASTAKSGGGGGGGFDLVALLLLGGIAWRQVTGRVLR